MYITLVNLKIYAATYFKLKWWCMILKYFKHMPGLACKKWNILQPNPSLQDSLYFHIFDGLFTRSLLGEKKIDSMQYLRIMSD